jgi:surfactin synthase thioesterase subunit
MTQGLAIYVPGRRHRWRHERTTSIGALAHAIVLATHSALELAVHHIVPVSMHGPTVESISQHCAQLATKD